MITFTQCDLPVDTPDGPGKAFMRFDVEGRVSYLVLFADNNTKGYPADQIQIIEEM